MAVVDREEIPLDGPHVRIAALVHAEPAPAPQDGEPRTRTIVLVLVSAEIGWLALLAGSIHAIWS